jgi:hypothetical protein
LESGSQGEPQHEIASCFHSVDFLRINTSSARKFHQSVGGVCVTGLQSISVRESLFIAEHFGGQHISCLRRPFRKTPISRAKSNSTSLRCCEAIADANAAQERLVMSYERSDARNVNPQGKTRVNETFHTRRREVRTGTNAIPYTKQALERDLEWVQEAWDDSQADRRRDAIYGYLRAVYDLLAGSALLPFPRRCKSRPSPVLEFRIATDVRGSLPRRLATKRGVMVSVT